MGYFDILTQLLVVRLCDQIASRETHVRSVSANLKSTHNQKSWGKHRGNACWSSRGSNIALSLKLTIMYFFAIIKLRAMFAYAGTLFEFIHDLFS